MPRKVGVALVPCRHNVLTSSSLAHPALHGPVAEARAALRAGAAAAAPWVRLGLSEAQRAAGMVYDRAGRIVDGAGTVLAEAGEDAARLAQEGKVAAAQGACTFQRVAAVCLCSRPALRLCRCLCDRLCERLPRRLALPMGALQPSPPSKQAPRWQQGRRTS